MRPMQAAGSPEPLGCCADWLQPRIESHCPAAGVQYSSLISQADQILWDSRKKYHLIKAEHLGWMNQLRQPVSLALMKHC